MAKVNQPQMNVTSDEDNPFGKLIERVEKFAQSTAELQKLKAIDKSADVLSNLAANFILILCLSFFYVILNIGIAIYLGQLVDSLYLGFFMLAGFHALLGLIIYFLRNKWIKISVKNKIISNWIS